MPERNVTRHLLEREEGSFPCCGTHFFGDISDLITRFSFDTNILYENTKAQIYPQKQRITLEIK